MRTMLASAMLSVSLLSAAPVGPDGIRIMNYNPWTGPPSVTVQSLSSALFRNRMSRRGGDRAIHRPGISMEKTVLTADERRHTPTRASSTQGAAPRSPAVAGPRFAWLCG